MNVADYFAARTVVTESGCWEWSLSRNGSGYGQARMRALYPRPVGAHRLSYELHFGRIPDGLTVDHLCFNPPCVNPDHLRLLTLSDNSRNQRRAYKTHCHRGHEYTPENTRVKEGGRKGKRDCKTCHAERERTNRIKRLEGVERPGQVRGERSATAVLTERDVVTIRRRRADGATVSELAREYGVSRSAVQSLLAGVTWKHVPMEAAA